MFKYALIIRFALLGLAFWTLFSKSIAQVVPNGTTPTTVSTNAAGRIVVGIAGANASGISHNSYTEFSVPKTGVSLNNQGINASTIVNEVTSSKRSQINGSLEVLGSRAHVIIANPNGITLDGASFINTGGVVLAGGAVRYENSALTGNENAIVSSGAGDIWVAGQGISGSMTTLQLLAARLKIEGPIINTHVSPNANIALNAGKSELELDSAVSPFNSIQNWANRKDLTSATTDILVDVTSTASLSASKININVNSKGAGVSFAGSGKASIGEFNITTNGKVAMRGGLIKAEKTVKIQSNSIDVLNTVEVQSNITSLTQDVILLSKIGDINLNGQISGFTRNTTDPDTKGGVTIKSAGAINIESENEKRLAIVFSSRDDLYVQSANNLINDTGRLLSNANTILKIGGNLKNLTSTVNAGPENEVIKTTKSLNNWLGWFGFKRRITTHTINWGSARIQSQLSYIAGNSIDINASRIDNSGEIDALSGALTLNARSIVNRQFGTGSFNISKNCSLTCWSKGTSTLSFSGGQINANGDLPPSSDPVIMLV